MTIANALASVAVKDLEIASAWYSRLLGMSPERPMKTVAEWHLSGGGGVQAYELPERAGHGSLTLVVTDIEQHLKELTAMGVDTSNRPSGNGIKTVMVTDPDGNHIALAELVG